ncbi:ubiquitin carboxyl-terminal hydrolase, putative [Eimeria praecox]|uniref:Ubiquitin carboxyl-terminal hydrolase, putative n=1 Tax=Eimeria praecox TaxID=51316 RepID=U6GZH9_9EIME|nr:ubiquitin carboxyl-terminal hydrolase, putative [Eimeria praecox]
MSDTAAAAATAAAATAAAAATLLHRLQQTRGLLLQHRYTALPSQLTPLNSMGDRRCCLQQMQRPLLLLLLLLLLPAFAANATQQHGRSPLLPPTDAAAPAAPAAAAAAADLNMYGGVPSPQPQQHMLQQQLLQYTGQQQQQGLLNRRTETLHASTGYNNGPQQQQQQQLQQQQHQQPVLQQIRRSGVGASGSAPASSAAAAAAADFQQQQQQRQQQQTLQQLSEGDTATGEMHSFVAASGVTGSGLLQSGLVKTGGDDLGSSSSSSNSSSNSSSSQGDGGPLEAPAVDSNSSSSSSSNFSIRRSRRAAVRRQQFSPASDSEVSAAAAAGPKGRNSSNNNRTNSNNSNSNTISLGCQDTGSAIAAAEAAAARLAADLESDDDWEVAATHAVAAVETQQEQVPRQLQRLLQQQQHQQQQQQQQQQMAASWSSPEMQGERWPWVYFNDSCVTRFAFPSGLEEEGQQQQQQQQQQQYDSSLLCSTDEVQFLHHRQIHPSFPSSLPLQQQQHQHQQQHQQQQQAENSSYLLSRTVHSVTYIRGDIVAAPEDPPLPPALEAFVHAENERLFSRLREQEERMQLLTSFVLQQQTFISHLLRQQLPAALRQLELQRQQQEAQQAFVVAAAAAEAGDNFAADAAEKQQLLPLLQQLAFVPKSWWASFVRGTDYPCVSVLLPQHLRPPRDSTNSNSYLHSATDKAGKAAAAAAAAAAPPPQQQQQEQQQQGDIHVDLEESDALQQGQQQAQQQQQHKKTPKRGSTAWTAAVCPEVLEEAGVVDYSSILCPHYIRHLQQQRRNGKRPSFWSANDPSSSSSSSSNSSNSSSNSAVGQPYGIDPLAVWSGEAKLVPVGVLKSIFAAVGLRASVETPLLQQAVCNRCAAALRGLADLSALQHREVDFFVSSAKQQHLIAAGPAAAAPAPVCPAATTDPALAAASPAATAAAAPAADGESLQTEQQLTLEGDYQNTPKTAQTANAEPSQQLLLLPAADGESLQTEQQLTLEGDYQNTPKTAQTANAEPSQQLLLQQQMQQQQMQQQQILQPQLKLEEEEFVLVSRRVLQHMLGQHAVYLSSCSAAAREGPRGGPLMTLLAAAAATQQQRGSRGSKCKNRRVCGDSAFAWAAYEDVRKEVIANRVWPFEEETLAAAAAAATAAAHASTDAAAGKAGLGTGRRSDSTGATTHVEGDADTHGSAAAAAAEDAAAAAGPTLDVSAELLCSHGNLLPLPLQHSKQKLSPRLLVPAAALLRYLSIETAKWPLLKELEVPQPLILSASRLVPQSASECTICLSEQQQQQQQRQRWRHRMKEEEKLLGPILGNRWTVKREPLQGTSKTHAAVPRAGVYQLVPEEWRSQWQHFVGSPDEETGMDLRPPPLDVSSLICDCVVPGLKVDPTDSVLSPAFLCSPPPSESAVCLTPPGPRPAAPVFSFPHLKPCPSCVPRLRMQPQGLYDFPPVDLPIHLAANCHHVVAAAQQLQQHEQPQTQQKGSSRSRSAQGSRLFSRRMMAEISGATPVDCAVASVVAAVTEASESVRRVRVALRVPGASVLFAAPELACAGVASAEVGDGVAGGEGALQGAAVHAVGGKPHYIELSSLAASGNGNLRMRQLGLRVGADCCIHYTVDGSDPVVCEDQVVGKPQAAQEQLQHVQQHQATAPVIELSVQSTNDTNCSNNSTTSGGSLNGGGSGSNSDGANTSSNKNSTNSSIGSRGSPGFLAKAEHCEDLTREKPLPMAHPSSPQQKL